MKKLLPIFVAVFCAFPILAQAETVAEKRAAVQEMEAKVLTQLYAEKPDTEREIAAAKGYAVFSTGELAVMWLSAGYGNGVAHNNLTGEDTYMQMAKAGLGLGLGAKDANIVFVFHEEKAMHDFIHTGLDLTGTADAAVKNEAKGEAASGGASVVPGVRIYQLTDKGLMAQAMIQGTKYWKDSELNNPNAVDRKRQSVNQ